MASGSAKGDIEHAGHCNNAIIEMKDYLIVVDANFPSGARLVLEDAKKVSPKPVKFVFDTHHTATTSTAIPSGLRWAVTSPTRASPMS